MSRYLDPKTDIVFKKIFGEHKHLLKSFLNALLPLPEDGLIVGIEYLSAEQVPAIPVLKRPIVDVKCTDQQGRIFIVEMQIEWTDGFMQRMLFNTSHAYVKQLKKGHEYHLLQPVYGVALLAENFQPTMAEWYHHYKMVNIQDTQKTIEGLQLVFVELKKFKPAAYHEKKLQALWLRFMRLNEKTEEIPADLLEMPEIKEAIHLLEASAYSAAELEYYDKYWDSVSCEKTLISERFTEGVQQGIQQGIQEGQYLMLIEILEIRFGKISETLTKHLKTLSAEQLMDLCKRALSIQSIEELLS
jgi:predicted transposase/invertase (TIGR01784 family)